MPTDSPPMRTDSPPIADRYRDAVERADQPALVELYRPDALLDAHVPSWRFQVRGSDAVAEHIGGGLPGPGRFTSFHAEPTASGDLVLQFEWHQHADHGGAVARQLHLLRLDDGRIAEQVVFCAGIWSPQLQAQMAAEAPLIQP